MFIKLINAIKKIHEKNKMSEKMREALQNQDFEKVKNLLENGNFFNLDHAKIICSDENPFLKECVKAIEERKDSHFQYFFEKILEIFKYDFYKKYYYYPNKKGSDQIVSIESSSEQYNKFNAIEINAYSALNLFNNFFQHIVENADKIKINPDLLQRRVDFSKKITIEYNKMYILEQTSPIEKPVMNKIINYFEKEQQLLSALSNQNQDLKTKILKERTKALHSQQSIELSSIATKNKIQ